MKVFFKAVLKLLGVTALVAGGLVMLVAITMAPDDPRRLDGLIGTAAIDLVLFGLGYLLLLFASNIRVKAADEPADFDTSGSRLHKLGIVLLLIVLVEIAICLPLIGRVIMAVLLLLIYARIDRDWSSKQVIGKTTYANIFDFTVGGLLYLLINVIWLALTAGRGGLIGGGGLSGGGGASGRW